ncbi:hypothetical protein F5883DRAFT_586053 [Diaporthe sp. PMI_573]|nr:hypothetical protein F5883DRAFT_586053 [Diaporthaceae sp. PMI_573]
MSPPASDGGERGPAADTLQLTPILSSAQDFKSLRDHIRRIDGDEVGNVAVLSFRALQLYRIAKLQASLIKLQNDVMEGRARESLENTDQDKQADELIQRYANAIRNYDTLSQAITFSRGTKYEFLGTNEAFKARGRSGKSKWWISQGDLTAATTIPDYDGIGPLGFRELDKKRLIGRENMKALKSRFVMALFGGVSLIVPMLIMALRPSLVVDLVTTSAATVSFAAVVTFLGTDASGKDVLASTAAYTAVLVVFVGASLQPSNQ